MKLLTIIMGSMILFATSCTQHEKKHADKSAPSGQPNPVGESTSASMDRMMNMKMSGDVDYDYAMMMVAHHQAAIDMSNVEIEKGADDSVKALAKNIKLTQAREISMMEAYMRSRSDVDGVNLSKEQDEDSKRTMNKMMTGMHSNPTGSIDRDYINMMIPHHQAAIDMNNNFLSKGKAQEMIDMANSINAEQKNEIAYMQRWLAVHTK
jgi:uncharacterized protein (DUF305 family)